MLRDIPFVLKCMVDHCGADGTVGVSWCQGRLLHRVESGSDSKRTLVADLMSEILKRNLMSLPAYARR